ncbi:hypothetical protein D5F01_LYC19117 [Larimichthys crocea]|uniref:LINE-1 type transposase domain-containing protein 1 n=1 Tax=Larimichthys crocea TaxID=215358 RepID=A0A6G0HXC1_LARCR|nr:hypothetical protein D5F01_LYC19117 [Larimichthys crocea]
MSSKPKSSGRQNPKNTTGMPAARVNSDANSPVCQEEDGGQPPGNVAEDIAEDIFSALKQISGELQSLGEIRKATSSMNEKLTTLVVSEVEGGLCFLEKSDHRLKANPLATKTEVADLAERLDDMEDRSRQNNLCFVGFPEGCGSSNPIMFLEKVLPEMLEIPTPKFMRLGDRDTVLHASQRKGELRWNGKRVMIFPDFSRGTVAKQDAFRECKKVLHQRGVKFALQYPATLCVNTKEGSHGFDNSKAAMNFIRTELSQLAGDME